ncbi:MAG: Kelch repeat-containing protein [Mangrovibacterium sp.]
MISKNLFVHKWAPRVLKLVMVSSIILSSFSCSDDDEDLLGNWVRLGSFEGYPRSGAVAVSLNGKAYVTTGYDDDDIDDDNIYRLKDMWEFNPESESWKKMEGMPDEAYPRDQAVGFAASGKVYIGTGIGEYKEGVTTRNPWLNDFWGFDPGANSWTRIADFPGTARYGAIAFSIKDKGYVCSGYDGGYLKDLWEYNPTTDTWSSKASFPGEKRRDAVVFVINDIAYVCTGIDNNQGRKDFYSYDPTTDKWTKLRDISDTSDESYDDDYNIVRSSAVAFTVDGKGYVCTASLGSVGSTVWEYDPGTDLWDEKTSFEGSSRNEAVAFTLNNIGYITTGRSSGTYFDDLWRFEPNAEQDDTDN